MNDKPKNTSKTSDSKKKAQPGPKRRLLRSKDERMIWGVAGGVGEHLNVDATLVRVGFVIAALFGGAGLLAYLVLAVALPEDDGTGKPVDEPWSARFGRVLLICLLVCAALAVAACLVVASAWTVATGHGVIVAAVVIGLGALLAIAAFTGEMRKRVAPWVIGGALLLAVPAGAVAAADIEIDESVGQREYTPTAASELPADGYELGVGQLIVDLRELPFASGETIPVDAELGIGQMIVSIPPGVCVDADATAEGGELLIAGDRSDGVDAEVDKAEPTTRAPRLELDAGIQFGQILVTSDDPDEVDDHRGPGVDQDRNEEEADAQRQICGR
jgi:phage shock protein PspC (stress-responsive transcriptional regulator)